MVFSSKELRHERAGGGRGAAQRQILGTGGRFEGMGGMVAGWTTTSQRPLKQARTYSSYFWDAKLVENMIIIPAIDIKGRRCVRLRQGKMTDETVYSENPVDMALTWVRMGAERLHLVDLDGAVQGKPVNRQVVSDIVDAIPAPVQVGGGMRNMDHIEAYLAQGVRWVILGTAALRDPVFLRTACQEYPNRVILAIDANRGQVAVEGWTEETSVTAKELAKRYEDEGIAAIVYTDIERDGMSVGPNVASTEDLVKDVHVPVIASGGISGIEDVLKLLELEQLGVIGMITGRALYEGTLDLGEAIRISKA